jgi:monothiol glutaredoxin
VSPVCVRIAFSLIGRRAARHLHAVFPQCGFSNLVVQVLSHLGVKFKGIDVLSDPALRQGIKAFSDWPTVPQLYVKGEFVGGCDIVREMFETGELAELLATRGVTTVPT